MYWSYHLPQTLFYPTIFQFLPATSTTIPEVHTEPKQSGGYSKQQPQNYTFNLNLTAEDLQKAGYQNNKTPWTEEQDEKLKQLRDQQQLDWAELAKLMPGRNSKMCYSRYRRLQNNTKQTWRKKDDQLLIKLVETHGEQWKLISKHFEKRTHKQVKEHYLNYLRPEIKKDQWTLEQDLTLVEYLNIFGKNWKVIEQKFKGRTQNQIKNRYFGRLKRLADKKAINKQKSFSQSKKRREV